MAVLCLPATAQSVGTVVVPSSNRIVRGNRETRWPFTVTGSPLGRVQLCVDRTALAGFATEPIRRIYFRTPDFALDNRPVFVGNVFLSSTTAGPDSLSATLATNRGADHVQVASGSAIALRQAFVFNYYPSLIAAADVQPPFKLQAGSNLLIEIEVLGHVNNATIEVVTQTGDPIGMVEARGPGATSGIVSTSGYVTGIAFGEPAAATVLTTGGPNCGGGDLLVRGAPIIGDPTTMAFWRTGGRAGAQWGTIVLAAGEATVNIRPGCDVKLDFNLYIGALPFTTDDQGRMDPVLFPLPFALDILGAQIHTQAVLFLGTQFPNVIDFTQPLVLKAGL
jgi:hypothetical protein